MSPSPSGPPRRPPRHSCSTLARWSRRAARRPATAPPRVTDASGARTSPPSCRLSPGRNRYRRHRDSTTSPGAATGWSPSRCRSHSRRMTPGCSTRPRRSRPRSRSVRCLLPVSLTRIRPGRSPAVRVAALRRPEPTALSRPCRLAPTPSISCSPKRGSASRSTCGPSNGFRRVRPSSTGTRTRRASPGRPARPFHLAFTNPADGFSSSDDAGVSSAELTYFAPDGSGTTPNDPTQAFLVVGLQSSYPSVPYGQPNSGHFFSSFTPLPGSRLTFTPTGGGAVTATATTSAFSSTNAASDDDGIFDSLYWFSRAGHHDRGHAHGHGRAGQRHRVHRLHRQREHRADQRHRGGQHDTQLSRRAGGSAGPEDAALGGRPPAGHRSGRRLAGTGIELGVDDAARLERAASPSGRPCWPSSSWRASSSSSNVGATAVPWPVPPSPHRRASRVLRRPSTAVQKVEPMAPPIQPVVGAPAPPPSARPQSTPGAGAGDQRARAARPRRALHRRRAPHRRRALGLPGLPRPPAPARRADPDRPSPPQLWPSRDRREDAAQLPLRAAPMDRGRAPPRVLGQGGLPAARRRAGLGHLPCA